MQRVVAAPHIWVLSPHRAVQSRRVADAALIEVRLLGPVAAIDAAGSIIDLGSRKQRMLLAILALARGHVVSTDRLIDELWAGDPPARARTSLYSYVSNLRRALEPRSDHAPSVLTTNPPGY